MTKKSDIEELLDTRRALARAEYDRKRAIDALERAERRAERYADALRAIVAMSARADAEPADMAKDAMVAIMEGIGNGGTWR